MSESVPRAVRAPGFVRALAERQLRDYRRREPGTFFAEGAALSLDEAYALQAEVARLRIAEGDTVAGYKLGCIGPRILETFGMSGPIRGRLYRSEIHRSPARVSAASFATLAIEGEMALRIGDDGAAAEAFPVIELHNYVFRGARKTLPELVANNGLHAGVVLPARASGLAPPPDEGEISVEIDGVLVESGGLWAMPGGAPGALAWLSTHLAKDDLALRPGDLVLAGTPLGLHPVGAGSTIRVTAVDLPPVQLDVLR
jgi:2-keto-4-pentenoate hydratase